MQEVDANPPPQTTHDFAGLLAALAAAKPAELPAWSDEEFSGDEAKLSYESALRTHARYKSAGDSDTCSAQAGEMRQARSKPMQPSSGLPAARTTTARTIEPERKCASVTLRMSNAECEQLRERAAEAALSVSAYLRLCAFEAEMLRAQVKEALAEMRRAPAPETKLASEAGTQPATAENSESSRGLRLGWLRRLMPDMHPARGVAGV